MPVPEHPGLSTGIICSQLHTQELQRDESTERGVNSKLRRKFRLWTGYACPCLSLCSLLGGLVRCDRQQDSELHPQQIGSWHRLPWPWPPLEIPQPAPPSPALPAFSLNPAAMIHLRGCGTHSTEPAPVTAPGPPCWPSNPKHPHDNTCWEGSGQRVTCFWTPQHDQRIPREKHSARISAKRTEFCCFYISEVLPVPGWVKWV